jgi:hypothetical protein
LVESPDVEALALYVKAIGFGIVWYALLVPVDRAGESAKSSGLW